MNQQSTLFPPKPNSETLSPLFPMETTKQYSRKPSIDRLSALPDAILCHILSFLPTKFSAATSILSRRWRFLWTRVGILDLDSDNHHPETEFSKIVNRVLMLRKSQKMDTFRLSYRRTMVHFWTPYCSQFEVETWIATAIVQSVRNIYLLLSHDVRLPPCLFACKTLVDLRLYNCRGVPRVVCLPSLKKLHLYSVRYDSEEFPPHLISGCPVLEELIIHKILKNDLVCCRVSSPTIKRLAVNFELDDLGSQSDEYMLEINAPALRYLKVEDCLSKKMSTEVPSDLIEADISINNRGVELGYNYSVSLLEFLDNLRNLRFLKLLSDIGEFHYEALSKFSDPAVMFDNLTRLELAADWIFLQRLLRTAHNLKFLIIHKVKKDLSTWEEPQQVPKCLLSNLTTITFHHFGFEESTGVLSLDEYEMLRYFLRHALVLKRMEIHSKHWDIDLTEKLNAQKRISSFERGSNACTLTFD